jgi:hypothetical protein
MKVISALAGAALLAMMGSASAQAGVSAAETHDGGVTWAYGYEGASSIAVSLYGGGTIFSNPFIGGYNADCSFSTQCAIDAGRGDDFAAQRFTVSGNAVVTGGSFIELDLGVTPTDVSWGFANADGPGGLPGTFLSAGEDTVSSVQYLANDGGYNEDQIFFNVGPQALGPGTYWFAIQAVSSVHETYLGFGPAMNMGVPEPGAWALMLLGVGGIGAALRRRSSAAAAA